MILEIRRTRTIATLGRTRFFYRLVGGNNEVMMHSQPIKHKRSCFHSAEAIRDAFKSKESVAIIDKTYETNTKAKKR